LLHTGPGLANGLANLHNARRARSPIVNVVGDQATWHLAADAPLTSDIAGIARPVSGWVRDSRSAADVASDMADAIAAASAGQIATLIVPQDVQSQQVADGPVPHPSIPPRTFDAGAVSWAADLLRRAKPAALLLGGAGVGERGLRAAGRIAAIGCQLLCEPRSARMERGVGLPAPARLPYFPDHVLAALKPFRAVVMAGAREPVAFFGYDGFPSRLLTAAQETAVLASPAEDVPAALEALADELDAPAEPTLPPLPPRPPLPTGSLTPDAIAAAVAALQPEGAIIVDEGITTTATTFPVAAGAPRHSYLTITGGSIGYGPPVIVR
jgi:acetolactate synthase-1/2/3 large subunit